MSVAAAMSARNSMFITSLHWLPCARRPSGDASGHSMQNEGRVDHMVQLPHRAAGSVKVASGSMR
jgi:hypothetical protein